MPPRHGTANDQRPMFHWLPRPSLEEMLDGLKPWEEQSDGTLKVEETGRPSPGAFGPRRIHYQPGPGLRGARLNTAGETQRHAHRHLHLRRAGRPQKRFYLG